VLGADGGLVGIVTQSDLIGALFPAALAADASSQRPRGAPA
jgi:CBS-domain-containing membrane protein